MIAETILSVLVLFNLLIVPSALSCLDSGVGLKDYRRSVRFGYQFQGKDDKARDTLKSNDLLTYENHPIVVSGAVKLKKREIPFAPKARGIEISAARLWLAVR